MFLTFLFMLLFVYLFTYSVAIPYHIAFVASVSSTLATKATRVEVMNFLETKANKEELKEEAQSIFSKAEAKWVSQESVMQDHLNSTSQKLADLRSLIDSTEDRTRAEITSSYEARMTTAESQIADLQARLHQTLEGLATAAAATREREEAIADRVLSSTATDLRVLEERLGHKTSYSESQVQSRVDGVEARFGTNVCS